MAELVSIKRNVDVSPGQAAPAVFHCSQGDVGSKIILGLLNNGTAYAIPSGVTVTIEGSESNGSIFTPISATASGSDITFYLTGEMTAVAGPAICQAVLKSGSNILGTANFTLEVESSPMGADAPPVFTDAGWTWMLNKLNTEFVPALGDNIIDAIDSKADQSDLTALSNTVAGHTGSITVLNNTVNALNQSVTKNRQNIATKLDKNQGTTNAGKYLKVGADGNVETADLDVTTDKTLSIADKAADAKAVGDELDDLKADLNDTNADVDAIKDKLTVYGENGSFTLELGNIGNTGGKVAASYAMRTKYALSLANLKGRKLQILNDYWGVRVAWYSDNKYYVEYCVGVQNYYNDDIIDIQSETEKHGYSTATHYAFSFIHFINGAIDTSITITQEEQAAFGDNYRMRTIEWADTSILTTGNVLPRIEQLESENVINIFDKTTIANGRISIANGTVDYNVSSSRISDYIAVEPETKYILFPEYQATNHGMAFYDENKQFISGTNTSVSGTSGVRPYIFKTPTGAAFLRFSVYEQFVNKAYLYKYNAASIASASIPLEGEGQPIVIYPSVDIYPIFKVDMTNYGHPQGGAVFGNKLFCMTTNLENPFVIDMETYETAPIAYSETSTNHANNVSFSEKYYADGDAYPLMYVTSASGDTSNSCEIFRIAENNGEYSMTKLSTITLTIDRTKWRGFNAIVDAENDKFIVITTKYDGDVIVGNALLIYELPSDANTDITLEYIEKDSEHLYGFNTEILYEKKSVGTRAQDAYQQDAFVRDNKLYLAIGYSRTSVVNVIDANIGKRLSFVNISNVFTGEVEVCDTYDNGIVVIDEAGRGYFIKKLK